MNSPPDSGAPRDSGPPPTDPPPGGHPVPPPAGYPAPPPGGYQIPPLGGYPAPSPPHFPGLDPLISPDYSGWWARTTSVVRRGLRPLAQIQAIGFIPSAALQIPIGIYTAFLSRDLADNLRTPAGTTESPELAGVLAMSGLLVLATFVGVLVAAVVTIATIHVAVTIAVGDRPRLGAALRAAVDRAFPLLGWQVLAGLVILLGLCACVLPAIYLAAVFAVLPAVVAFERGGAIGRCFQLFHGDLGASVARIATIFTLTAGVVLVGAGAGKVLKAVAESVWGGDTGLAVGSALTTMASVLVASAAAVLTSTLTLTAYADMRARLQPLSTGILARELDLTQPPAGSPATTA